MYNDCSFVWFQNYFKLNKHDAFMVCYITVIAINMFTLLKVYQKQMPAMKNRYIR